MRLPWLALAFGFIAETLPAKEPSAGDLIDRMIAQPGDYNQLCMDSPVKSPPVRIDLPLYGLIALRSIRLSDENLEVLRRRRPEVVPALVQRLAGTDLSRPAPPVPKFKFKKPKKGEEEMVPAGDIIEQSGLSPYQLSGVLYSMIIGLDAVETLPELLRLEAQLDTLIVAAENNAKAPLPQAEPDGCVVAPFGKLQLSKREEKIYRSQVTQRELLSVMMQLLRRQQFKPLIESSYEQRYGALLKARAAKEDLRDIKTPEEAKNSKSYPGLAFDPIHQVPVGYLDEEATTAFSRAARKEIRGLVTKFLETVARDQWQVTGEPVGF